MKSGYVKKVFNWHTLLQKCNEYVKRQFSNMTTHVKNPARLAFNFFSVMNT